MFIHSLQPWAHTLILQRSEVLRTYQEIMKVAKCTGKKIHILQEQWWPKRPPQRWLQGNKKEQGGKGSPQRQKNPMMKKIQKVNWTKLNASIASSWDTLSKIAQNQLR